jgi:hypothetical protein
VVIFWLAEKDFDLKVSISFRSPEWDSKNDGPEIMPFLRTSPHDRRFLPSVHEGSEAL